MSSSDASDPRIGSILADRYRLDERLAAGGMGVVYRGEQLELRRKVAVKFLHEALSFVPDLKKRFQREVQAMGRLQHPNLVAILDSGMSGGVPFLVMDFHVGRPLSQLITEDGALPPKRALAIVRQLLAGVAHAHKNGIVHRDLKPDNVLLVGEGKDEQLKILDFGLAKMVGDSGSGLTQLTNSGLALGTPSYMSPEQARGAPADERADIYAVGLILYELVAGRRPFVAETPMAVLRMHMEDPPPQLREVSEAGRKVSRGLAGVVHRALVKDPTRRWPSAVAFLRAIDATVEGGGSEEKAAALLESSDPAFAQTMAAKAITPPSEAVQAEAAGGGAKARVEEELVPPPRAPSPPSGERPIRRGGGLALRLLLLVLVAGGAAFGWSKLGKRERERVKGVANDAWQRTRSAVEEQLAHTPEPTPALPVPGSARPAPVAEKPAAPKPAPVTEKPAPTAQPVPAPVAKPVPETAPVVKPVPEPTPTPGPQPTPAPVAEADDGDDDDGPEETGETPGSRLEKEAESSRAAEPAKGAPKLADAAALLAAGRTDDAIRMLYRLRRAQPKSPDVALLLGHAYFKKLWRSDGLREYATALQLRPSLRGDARLRRNLVTALENPTSRRARTLLRGHVGAAALPELRAAAKSAPSPKARRRAAVLVAELSHASGPRRRRR